MNYVKKIGIILLTSILLISCGGSSNTKKISLAYANWAEGIAVTHLTKLVLEEQGYDVTLMNADIAPIFASLSRKKADVFLDVWLPVTHNDYLKEYGDELDLLGTIFDDAKIGLVVPSYVNINSIEELNGSKERFNEKIVGIDAGAGIMTTTAKAITEYELDYELLTSSGPAMTATLEKAIKNEEWVVVTGWTPHYMFNQFDLKILDDPKNTYGEAELIQSACWKGFREKDPFATELIANIQLNNEEISSLMSAVESSKDESEGAKEWLKKNRELVNSWLPKN